MKHEYIAIPAPTRNKRAKGRKTAVERLAFALTDTINEMAEDGWEYLRTETLTVEDKAGRFSKVVERIETVIVFRRPFDYVENKPVEKQEPTILKRDPDPVVNSTPIVDEADSVAPALGGASR